MSAAEGYQALFDAALDAGRRRDYRRSIELLSKITSETDAVPQAFLFLGRSYHALGQHVRAIQPLRYFIQSCPDVSAGYFFLGRALLALDLPAEAVRNFKRALELEPKSVHALGLIGMAYLKARRPELAADYLARAVVLDPENKGLYTAYLNALLIQAIKSFHRGNLDLSRQLLEFISDKGRDGILLHLYLAIIYRESNDVAAALNHYDEALKLSPDDPVIRLQRAVLLHRSGDVRTAEQELGKLEIVPDAQRFEWEQSTTDRVLAIQHFKKNKHVKAIFFAEQVLHLLPKDIDMHLLVGESYRVLGEMTKARNHFERVIDVDRNLVEPRLGIAMVLWQEEKWTELMNELNVIERLHPENEISRYYAALVACRIGRPTEETIPALQEQLRKNGPDPHLMSALGGEYIRSGMSDLAEKWFLKSIALAEDDEAAHLGLIEVYRELGPKKKAKDAYRRFFKHFDDKKKRREFIQFLVECNDYRGAATEIERFLPRRRGNRKLQRLLALCYRNTKRFRDASIIYRRLLREDPKNEDYLRSLVFCMDKLGNQSAAIDLLEKAVKVLPPSVGLHLIVGVLYYRGERLEDALRHFRLVVDAAKTDWRGYYNMAMVYRKQRLTSMADKYLRKADALRAKTEKAEKTPSAAQ